MLTRRPSLAAAGSLACAALALWVSFGALTFIDADNSAAPVSYVGLLPPVSWLALFLFAAGFIAIIVRPPARIVAPLWLSAVAILPWLPFRLPLSVFVWTGNLLLWLWTAIGVAMLAPAVARMIRSEGLARMAPRRAAVLAGILAAALFGLGTWHVAPQHPEGDEPHYLVITQSILEDHDLKIENNHRQRDYRAYVSRTIRPDFLKRGTDGQIYSIHAPGLPLLVAPAFALLGYRGVLVELVLISAAASALAWLIAWRVSGDSGASWFAWAVVTLSVPFFLHASAVFPDGLAAVLMLVALVPLVDARAREPQWLMAIGATLAVLPWLHSRFAILAAPAGLVVVGRVVTDQTRRGRRLVAFALCPAISAVCWFLFFQIIYGTPNPSVAYGGANSTAVANVVRGAPGLLFDQQFGLIPNAPVYLCAFAGMAVMLWRGPRRLALELLVTAVPYFFLIGCFHMWWAGTTAPARFLVPVTLLMCVPTAIWFATAKSVSARTVGLGALFVSILMTATIASVGRGEFVFNFRDGMSRVAHWLSPVVDLTKALPSLFQNPPPTVLLQTAIWLAAIAVAVAVAAVLNRRGRTAVILGFGLALEVVTMAAASLVWRSNHAVVAMPHASGPAVLWHYNVEANQIAIAYRPFHRLEPADLPGWIVLARTASSIPRSDSASAERLPAGIYEIAGSTIGATTGRLRLRVSHLSLAPIADWDAASLGADWRERVTLPVAVASLEMNADADARRTIRDVSMRAVSRSEPQEALADREAKDGARYGSIVIFLMSGDAWVEPAGIWVAGGSSADFALAPDHQGPIHLALRNGPVQNDVTLESGAWRENLTLKPGEERVVQVSPYGRSEGTPLNVAATKGFRPSDVDPKNEDERFLGVRIETR